MNLKIKWKFEKYSPNESINWKEVNSKYKRIYIYEAKLYNSFRNNKYYPLKLILIANKKTESFTLIVKGNLNKWYSPKGLKTDLTLENYQECIKILFEEIGINQ